MDPFITLHVAGSPQLEAKIDALGNLSTVAILDEGAAVLFNRMRTRFLQETDPTGQQWPKSQAALRRAQRGFGGGTLFDTGKMFRSLQLYAENTNTRAIGTNVTSRTGFPYPVAHQYGFGTTRRQFVGFGNPDVLYMSDLVIRRLVESLL